MPRSTAVPLSVTTFGMCSLSTRTRNFSGAWMFFRQEGNGRRANARTNGHARAGTHLRSIVQDSYTVGVEEEYLTVDSESLELRPRGDRILAAARPALGDAVQAEMNLAQIEVATRVCRSIPEIDAELRWVRTALAAAA